MKRYILVYFLLFASFIGHSQIIDGVYKKHIIKERKAAPLPQFRECDIMWQKTVWRLVDLREKINLPLYYPIKPMEGRFNFINVLLKGIENGKIGAFDPNVENEFTLPMEYSQVKDAMGAATTETEIEDIDTGEMIKKTVSSGMRADQVKQLLLKEVWFFDKQSSTLQVRIIGICPIREYYRDDDVDKENVQRQMTFWIYYPEVRDLLASNESFNPYNSAGNLSFDDIFVNRVFNGYIIREENMYGNRAISQYASGEYAIEESKRIQNEILDWEQDLWEY